MILAQAVLAIFCSQGSISLQWENRKSVGKGLTLCNEKSDGKEKKTGPLNFHTYSTFQVLSLTVLDRMQSVTHHTWTGFEVAGTTEPHQ